MSWELLLNLLGLSLQLFSPGRKNDCNTCNSCPGGEQGKKLDFDTKSRFEIENVSTYDTPSPKLERSTNKKPESIGFFPALVITFLGLLASSALFGNRPQVSHSQRTYSKEPNPLLSKYLTQQQVDQTKLCETELSAEIAYLLEQDCAEPPMRSIDEVDSEVRLEYLLEKYE